MTRRTIITTILIGAGLGATAIGAGVALAGGDDTEQSITGSALEQASAAALEHTGGGTVTETEVGDEDSMYEVELTLDDGSQVDVQLDADFNVVSAEADTDDATEDD
jgi:uncharacterized membrane protein YkoI